jgi:hypothetical protein
VKRENEMKKVIAVGFFVWLLCASFAARADDAEQATLVAQQILHMISEDRLNTLWDTLVSKFFKDKISKNVFLANLSDGRASVGGAYLSSQVVDITYRNADPQSGYTADFYTCRFLTKYPAGNFYLSVTVVKELDGQFRLAHLFSSQAPSN